MPAADLAQQLQDGLPLPRRVDLAEHRPAVWGRADLPDPQDAVARQVWNRQRTDHTLLDPANTTLGTRDVRRWNTPENWSISTAPAHRALVSEADFVAIQNIRASRETAPGREYLLAGLLRCALCQRQMDSCWSHQRPAYRHPERAASALQRAAQLHLFQVHVGDDEQLRRAAPQVRR
ncbi:hypothetical protein T261_1589 [Streptomyces lydicus]|nr:hypothetical protein T261_1589 [Streptomyces lydicus]